MRVGEIAGRTAKLRPRARVERRERGVSGTFSSNEERQQRRSSRAELKRLAANSRLRVAAHPTLRLSTAPLAMRTLGKALRETGQAVERMGMRAQDNFSFAHPFCRHRAVMNLFDQRPFLARNAFVAPNASVIGSVKIEDSSSVWYGAVLRGDQSPIHVGGYTSIGDRSVLQSSAVNPTGFSAQTHVGDYVTIGQGCLLRGCTVEDGAVIGDGSIIMEGALVDTNAMLEPGSVLPSGALVPEGEVYGGNPAAPVRKLSKEEIDHHKHSAEMTAVLAAKHEEEFLPYGTLYQQREKLEK